MRLLVAGGRFADREGLATRLAAVAPGTGLCETEGLVAVFAYRNAVIPAGRVRATGQGWFRQGGQEAVALLGDSGIALDRRIFTAHAAGKRGHSGAGALHGVAVLRGAVCSGAANNGLFWRDAVVAASGVLAEVDLNAASLGGDAPRLGCGRIYPGNENPLQR